MTKKEAIQLENEIRQYLLAEADQKNVNAAFVNRMMDNFIEIYPDQIDSMGMFYLGKMGDASKSVRLGNVMFNQKALLGALADLALSVSAPDDWYSYVTIALAGIIFAGKMVTKEIGEAESYIVAYLHNHDMYTHGKEEAEFYSVFPQWYEEKTGDTLSDQRFRAAMDNLLEMASIEIEDGEVRLKEKVWKNHLV